jgi:hypothetical protein
MSKIYVAKATFHCKLDGHVGTVFEGQTVREGHPLLSQYRDMFVPQRVDFEHQAEPKRPEPVVEQATAEPGEKRRLSARKSAEADD